MEVINKYSINTQQWILRSELQDDIPLTGQLYIGRDSEADICIPDHRISRKHARVSVSQAGVLFEDLGSANGSSINGHKIHQAVILKPNDKIKVHTVEFQLINIAKHDNNTLLLNSDIQKDIILRGCLTVGRDVDCNICIPDHRISRNHAKIIVTPTGAMVEDLNSINGTSVNGTRINQATRINSGDVVHFHKSEFRVNATFDPDATRICNNETDINATRCDRIIVNKNKSNYSSAQIENDKFQHNRSERNSFDKNRDEVIRVDHPPQQHRAPLNKQVKTPYPKKLSAIQLQLNETFRTAKQKLQQLKVGMWVEFKDSKGTFKEYCLISIDKTHNTKLYFVNKSGFGLIKKETGRLQLDISKGHFRFLNKAPNIGLVSSFIMRAKMRKSI